MAFDEPTLHALARRIQATIAETGRCLLTLPADLAPFKALRPEDLRQFAASHGWTAVPRLGFAQLEFFTVNLPRVPSSLV
jgi:hypothetical protein